MCQHLWITDNFRFRQCGFLVLMLALSLSKVFLFNFSMSFFFSFIARKDVLDERNCYK